MAARKNPGQDNFCRRTGAFDPVENLAYSFDDLVGTIIVDVISSDQQQHEPRLKCSYIAVFDPPKQVLDIVAANGQVGNAQVGEIALPDLRSPRPGPTVQD